MSQIPILIGLHGQKGAGKDTAFPAIQQWAQVRGLRAERRGFADKLKLSAARLFHPDATLEEAIQWCDGMKEAGTISAHKPFGKVYNDYERRITGREFLQRYGTESHRDVFGTDFWVDQLLPHNDYIDEFNDSGKRKWHESFKVAGSSVPSYRADICVITDCRFPNEAQRIKILGGEIWKIVRPGLEDGDQHSSEIPLDDDFIDATIINGSTIDDLHTRVRNFMTAQFNTHFEETTQ